MTGAKSFEIKGGTFYILSDRLEISSREWLTKIGSWLYTRGLQSAFWLYLGPCLLLLMGTGLSFTLNNYFLTGFLAAASLLMLYYAIARRKYTFASVIFRNEIQSFVYHPAVPGVSRAYFEIQFLPTNSSRALRRSVQLPSRMYNGASLADTAYWMVKDEGLIQENS